MYTSSVCCAPAGGTLSPQPVDQDVTRYRLIGAEQENREQRPLLPAADINGMTVNANLKRSQ